MAHIDQRLQIQGRKRLRGKKLYTFFLDIDVTASGSSSPTPENWHSIYESLERHLFSFSDLVQDTVDWVRGGFFRSRDFYANVKEQWRSQG